MLFFNLKKGIWNFSWFLSTCCPSKIIRKTISKIELQVFPKTQWHSQFKRHSLLVSRLISAQAMNLRYKILIEIYPLISQLKLVWTCTCDRCGQETQNSIYFGRRQWLWASRKRAQYYIHEFSFYIKNWIQITVIRDVVICENS